MSIFVFDEEDNMHKIGISDVTCIHKIGESRKIALGTRQDCFYLPSTMFQLSEVFSQFDFFQIDKNKLINLRQIDEISAKHVILGDKVYVVAKRRLQDIKNLLEKLDN